MHENIQVQPGQALTLLAFAGAVPSAAAERLSALLQIDLSADQISSMIDSSLYRERLVATV